MYVKTFVSESLDDAFKQIKKELGPEAIILKTVTNKGLKGAFKKNKIEITAAITEKNYTRKANVDHVLNDEQKEKFYKGSSENISHMIDNYDLNKTAEKNSKNKNKKVNPSGPSNYGNLGLNKAVKQKTPNSSNLDDFLNIPEPRESYSPPVSAPPPVQAPPPRRQESPRHNNLTLDLEGPVWEELLNKMDKIDDLEKKLHDLVTQQQEKQKGEAKGFSQLRIYLQGLGIGEEFVQSILRDVLFEFYEEELNNFDPLLEYALNEMNRNISTALPLFSSTEIGNKPVITLLISQTAAGQTSSLFKLGNLKKNSLLIIHGDENIKPKDFTAPKLLNLELVTTKNMAELVSACRIAVESGRSVFVDVTKNYKNPKNYKNETKNVVESIRKSFEFVEVLLCLSAVHSENYNISCLHDYKDLTDGTIFTFLDQCINYANIFNIHLKSQLPIKFFSTGNGVPEDFEAASQERILSKIISL